MHSTGYDRNRRAVLGVTPAPPPPIQFAAPLVGPGFRNSTQGFAPDGVIPLPLSEPADFLIVWVYAGGDRPDPPGEWVRSDNPAGGLALYVGDGGPTELNLGVPVLYTAYAATDITGVVTAAGSAGALPSANIAAPSIAALGASDLLVCAYLALAPAGIEPPPEQVDTAAVQGLGATLRTGWEYLSGPGATGSRVAASDPPAAWVAGAAIVT